jgi:pyruvate dehydrogenase E1 component alpha subunit
MHITHPATGVMVTTGVVGSTMPIANGLALASQIKGEKRVTIANFGDGAANIGAFHESLNLASIWRLPVIFLCQNNLYSEHSRFDKFTAGGRVSKRADGLGMPGVVVNGNDPVAMWTAARDAVDRARSGGGPTLIEALTFRFHGHLLGDDAKYIPKEEIKAALAADPVPALRANLIAAGHATEMQIRELEAEIEREVSDAQAYAFASPWPAESELSVDVFAAVGPVKSRLKAGAIA